MICPSTIRARAPRRLVALLAFAAPLALHIPAHAADVPDEWCWRPPELGRRDGPGASPASDVFMLGGLIYEALSGGRRLPPASGWPGPCVHERPEYSLRRDTTDPRVAAVSALLRRMLVVNPKRRLTARQVARACRGIRTGTSVGGRSLLGA